jgi:hypothetical protein
MLEVDNPTMLERKREICPSISVLNKKCTSTHKRKKLQAQENGKDIGALKHKTHYKRDHEDHKVK